MRHKGNRDNKLGQVGNAAAEGDRQLISLTNAEISKVILGNTLTTEQGERGARSLGEVHQSSEEQLILRDRIFLLNILNHKIKPLLQAGGIAIKEEEMFYFKEVEEMDLARRILIDTQLNALISIPQNYFYETYNIPKPEGSEPLAGSPDPSDGDAEEGNEKKEDGGKADKKEKKKEERLGGGNSPNLKENPSAQQKGLRLRLNDILNAFKYLFKGGETPPPFLDRLLAAADIRRLNKNIAMLYGRETFRLNEEGDTPAEDDSFLETFYEAGWDGKTLNKKQIKKTAQKLFEKINPVLKEFTAPVSQKFKENVFHFSGAKNYQELKTLSQAAYDPKTGRKTSFKEFKAVAQKIDSQYNKRWLKTEQNFAYMSLLMSEKWHRFEAGAMLEYQTQGDGAVRDSHRAWHGVRKPKGDAFWQRCYPPNGWGCRCFVIETNDDKATPPRQTPPVTEEAVPQMFQTNVAEKGLVFPEKHPYFKMPAGVKKAVQKQAERVGEMLTQEETYALPVAEQFEAIKTYKNGGSILRHRLVSPEAKDYKTVMQAAEYHASRGKKADLLPIIHPNQYGGVREKLLPGAKENKCPDLRVNGEYVEVEEAQTTKRRALNKRLIAGSKQADIVTLILPHYYENEWNEYILKREKELNIKVVVLKNKGE